VVGVLVEVEEEVVMLLWGLGAGPIILVVVVLVVETGGGAGGGGVMSSDVGTASSRLDYGPISKKEKTLRIWCKN